MFERLPNRGMIFFKSSGGTVLTSAFARWGPVVSTYSGVEVPSNEVKNTAFFKVMFSQWRLTSKLVRQSHYIWINLTESYLITGLKDFGSHTEIVGLRQSVPIGFVESTAGGIVSEWAFRSSGEILTDEAGLNTLTNFGTVTWSADIPSQLSTDLGSSVYNGSNNLERTDASQVGLDITGQIVICGRVKFDSTVGTRAIVCKGDAGTQRGYYLYLSAGKVRFELSSDGTATTAAIGGSTLANGLWYSIAGVYDGSKIYIYLNGVADGNTSYSSGIFNNNTKFTLGVRGDDTQFLDGNLAHVLICNQSKTATQIANWHSTDILE